MQIRPWLIEPGADHLEENFMVFTSGTHEKKPSAAVEASHGIHPKYAKIVDDLLKTGLTPSKILQFLRGQETLRDGELQEGINLPTALQITTVF